MQYGEIGQILKDGKQVGGFRNWNLEVYLEEVTSDLNRKYTTQKVRATSKRFWLDEPIVTGKYMVLFYQQVGKELVSLFQNELNIKIPANTVIGEYVDSLLDMEG